MSIQNKLILSILSFFSVVILIMTIFSYYSFRSSSYNSNKYELETVARSINKAVGEKMDGYFNVLELSAKAFTLANDKEGYSKDDYRLDLLYDLSEQVGGKEAYYGLLDGRTYAKDTNGIIPNFNAKDLGREWYRRIFNGEPRIVTTPYVSSIGDTVMAVGVGIYDGRETIGTLCINLLMSEITEFTKEILDFENIYLTRADGYLMASRDEEHIGMNLWEVQPSLEQFNDLKKSSSFTYEFDGDTYEGSMSIIKSLGWKVWTFEKRSIVLADSRTNLIINVVVAILALILSVVMVKVLVLFLIFKPLQVVEESISGLENGDLSTRNFGVIAKDEIGSLLSSMQNMVEKLQGVVAGVRESSENVASGSSELSLGNQDLSGRTEAQAAALEETSAAIEEMNASIRSNADNTKVANKLSIDVSDKALEGTQAVSQMIGSMNEISSFSSRIADIIDVINNIAFQTNLLALNASIEAARAGEQGKGFAVVAVEVRKLAKRSDKAATEIANIIKTSNLKVSEGVEIADTAGSVLSEINDAVRKVTSLIGEISQSSQEQLSSADQIDRTLSTLDEDTQKNAALVEEASSSTDQLTKQAKDLNNSMKFFKLESGDKESYERVSSNLYRIESK